LHDWVHHYRHLKLVSICNPSKNTIFQFPRAKNKMYYICVLSDLPFQLWQIWLSEFLHNFDRQQISNDQCNFLTFTCICFYKVKFECSSENTGIEMKSSFLSLVCIMLSFSLTVYTRL
jgi:hypothetical protein